MENSNKKPKVKLSGTDGNVFALMAKCTRELKRIGQNENAKNLVDDVYKSESYSEAIKIMRKYCEIS